MVFNGDGQSICAAAAVTLSDSEINVLIRRKLILCTEFAEAAFVLVCAIDTAKSQIRSLYELQYRGHGAGRKFIVIMITAGTHQHFPFRGYVIGYFSIDRTLAQIFCLCVVMIDVVWPI